MTPPDEHQPAETRPNPDAVSDTADLPRPSQAEGPDLPGAETAKRPPRPSQAEGERKP